MESTDRRCHSQPRLSSSLMSGQTKCNLRDQARPLSILCPPPPTEHVLPHSATSSPRSVTSIAQRHEAATTEFPGLDASPE